MKSDFGNFEIRQNTAGGGGRVGRPLCLELEVEDSNPGEIGWKKAAKAWVFKGGVPYSDPGRIVFKSLFQG